MMRKRNASEYIIGSKVYRDTHMRYCRRRAKFMKVWHGGLVGLVLRTRVEWSPVVVVAGSLCELHSSGAACSKYKYTRSLVASMIQHATFLCVTPTHVMLTFARSAHS